MAKQRRNLREVYAGRRRTVRMMADEGWQRKFVNQISLPDGRILITLMDAGDYIAQLPKKQSALADWQLALNCLMICSRGGDMMLAQVGFMKALGLPGHGDQVSGIRVVRTPLSRTSPRKLS